MVPEKILKVFTTYGCGGHIGRVTWTVGHIFFSSTHEGAV